jgi:hypothetical protein
MRVLLLAFLLSIATVVPAFADGDSSYRPSDEIAVVTTVDNWDGAR